VSEAVNQQDMCFEGTNKWLQTKHEHVQQSPQGDLCMYVPKDTNFKNHY